MVIVYKTQEFTFPNRHFFNYAIFCQINISNLSELSTFEFLFHFVPALYMDETQLFPEYFIFR